MMIRQIVIEQFRRNVDRVFPGAAESDAAFKYALGLYVRLLNFEDTPDDFWRLRVLSEAADELNAIGLLWTLPDMDIVPLRLSLWVCDEEIRYEVRVGRWNPEGPTPSREDKQEALAAYEEDSELGAWSWTEETSGVVDATELSQRQAILSYLEPRLQLSRSTSQADAHADLSRIDAALVAVWELEDSVASNGIAGYLREAPSYSVLDAMRGLQLIGASKRQELVESARESLAQTADGQAPAPSDDLDARWWACSESLVELILLYMEGLGFVAPGLAAPAHVRLR